MQVTKGSGEGHKAMSPLLNHTSYWYEISLLLSLSCHFGTLQDKTSHIVKGLAPTTPSTPYVH